jgi:hypothetical protein
LRLDLNLLNTEEGRPFVKMLANCDVVGTWRTRTWPMATFSNKVEINLHMLGTLMLNGVGREVDGADVIAVDQRAPRQRTLELMEQLPQSSGLGHTIRDNTVLGLRVGTGDDSLPFGQPGCQIGPEEDRVA